jgi:phenylalanyl-tRNA synthetase beta chain
MKILYSQIKELIPGLKAGAKEIGEVLTMTGFMMDSLEEIKFNNKKDYLIGLEVRQNRGDLLGVIGIAREVAAYYSLKCKLPKTNFSIKKNKVKEKLAIKVKAKQHVKRVLAVQIGEVKNLESPKWLKDFLKIYDMNPINLAVDLSNYVMFLTGYPSHLIDVDQMEGNLAWVKNEKFKKLTTLDGTKLKLENKDELLIVDDKKPLGLAGLVGGKEAGITKKSQNIIIEMAVYDNALITKNARDLKVTTEAGNRLSKILDPNSSQYAFELLVSLILEQTKGKQKTKVFEYFPSPRKNKEVEMNWEAPSIYSGVEIDKKFAKKALKNLRFEIIKEKKDSIIVKAPIDRVDIELMEDVVEEVIRMYNFKNIKVDQIPKLAVTPDITPKVIELAKQIRDFLSANGLDEILSLPLLKTGSNELVNYSNFQPIETENPVNDEYPELQISIISGLLNQVVNYQKKNIDYLNLYEIGKVFYQKGNSYQEFEALGILLGSEKNNQELSQLKLTLEKLLRNFGITEISYKEASVKPKLAHPKTAFDVFVNNQKLGIIYKLKPIEKLDKNLYFTEINLDELTKILTKIRNITTVELTKKLVILDANLVLTKDQSIDQALTPIRKKIKKNLWSLQVVDSYQKGNQIKYTVRVSYQELSDQEAKAFHLKAFGLE